MSSMVAALTLCWPCWPIYRPVGGLEHVRLLVAEESRKKLGEAAQFVVPKRCPCLSWLVFSFDWRLNAGMDGRVMGFGQCPPATQGVLILSPTDSSRNFVRSVSIGSDLPESIQIYRIEQSTSENLQLSSENGIGSPRIRLISIACRFYGRGLDTRNGNLKFMGRVTGSCRTPSVSPLLLSCCCVSIPFLILKKLVNASAYPIMPAHLSP